MGQTALGEILPALKVQNPFGKLSVQGGKRDGVPEATERFGSGGLLSMYIPYINFKLLSSTTGDMSYIWIYTFLVYI